jgi:hypothetical protein
VERLSQHGDHLAALVRDNAERVQVIGTVGQAALNNMEQLRAQLPVIASATKDLTNNIGNTGRVAQAHLTDMVHGLNRLNDFGLASERQVDRCVNASRPRCRSWKRVRACSTSR